MSGTANESVESSATAGAAYREASLRAALEGARQEAVELLAQVGAERQAKTAAEAQYLEIQRHFSEATLRAERDRDRFSADLVSAQTAVEPAAKRTDAAEHHRLVVDRRQEAKCGRPRIGGGHHRSSPSDEACSYRRILARTT